MNYIEFIGDSFNMDTNEFNPNKAKEQSFAEKRMVNILLLGATGVGKSTLINAMFGKNIAKAGSGKPFTQKLETHDYPEKGLRLWDTKGIESADYEQTKKELENIIEHGFKEGGKKSNPDEAPHIAWLCIKETSARIEPREEELLKMLQKYGMPTVVVFTQTQFENGDKFYNFSFKHLNSTFPFIKSRFVRVNSEEYSIAGIKVPKSGLDQLESVTSECLGEVDENLRKQFRKMQLVDIEKRFQAMKEGAEEIVNKATVAAGTVGISPIPGSDAPLLAAIQSTMIYKLNSEFEVGDNVANTSSVVMGILGVTGIAQVGKAVVSNLLKFIPGANIAGMVVSAATASAITKAIGHAYISVLKHYFNHETGQVEFPESTEDILLTFKNSFNFKG